VLESGGVYIIEDISTSYSKRGKIYRRLPSGGYPLRYGLGHPKSFVEIFKKVVDGVNNKYSNTYSDEIQHQEQIHSITFAKNCIIIIKKESTDDAGISGEA
jgi:hypothetical protein